MPKTCTRTSLCEIAALMEPASCLHCLCAEGVCFTMLECHAKSR